MPSYDEVAAYGRWKVVSKPTTGIYNSTEYFVQHDTGTEKPVRKIGDGKDGRKLAKTLAAALESAEAYEFDILPPEFGPSKHGDADEWESWAGETSAVPARVAGAGKAPLAGWLKVVNQERESWIANRLGVSEQTVTQYLSDLREGRR